MVLSKSFLELLKNNKRCIYKLVNPTGNIYIGQTVNLYKRIMKYKNLDCSGQHILYNSLKKHSFFNHEFSVVETFDENTPVQLINEREIYHIEVNKLLCIKMLNIREGGGSKGKMSDESKLKMSKSRIGKIPWNKGIKTGISPSNKGVIGGLKKYTFYKNGEHLIIDDIVRYCQQNNLDFSSMIRVHSGNGYNGKRGEYKGYTKVKNWVEPKKMYLMGENHPTSKFNRQQVLDIRKRRSLGEMVIKIATEYQVNEETIRNCVKLKTYKNIKL